MANSIQMVIKEIAENLDCGYNCYYNSKTNEVIAIPNFLDTSEEEEFKENFRESFEKINNQKADLIKVEVLKNFETFKIMEKFIEQLTDQQFRTSLENILQSQKPFQYFNQSINNSDYRLKWFAFKQKALERIVEGQLK